MESADTSAISTAPIVLEPLLNVLDIEDNPWKDDAKDLALEMEKQVRSLPLEGVFEEENVNHFAGSKEDEPSSERTDSAQRKGTVAMTCDPEITANTNATSDLAHVAEKKPLIQHVLCVAFHHRNGPQVEYACPAFPGTVSAHDQTEADGSRPAVDLPEEWSFLPFLCLPDGAHATEEEFIYFHLPPVKDWGGPYKSTLFGLACYRQIPTSELLIKTADFTRNTVQKAVVVLSTEPILGSLRTKLGVVTQAFFAQRDFASASTMDILQNLYDSLHNSVFGPVSDANLYTGISLRELIYKFKHKSLQLFKLLLLEKRILFYGQKVERLSSYQYSLVSLMPELLRNIEDVGSPLLSYHPPVLKEVSETADTNKQRLCKLGLPLRVFGQGAFFQPYIPLQQIDVLMSPTTKSFMVGTSNVIFTTYKACAIDAVVNVDTGEINIPDSVLSSAIALTGADKRFIEEIVKCVTSTWSQEDDPSQNQQLAFEGSDDDIRARFESYLISLLASVKYTANPEALPPKENDSSSLSPPVKLSENYTDWNEHTTAQSVLKVSSPGHPKEGTSVMAIFQSSMALKLQELGKSISSSQNVATPQPEKIKDLSAHEKNFILAEQKDVVDSKSFVGSKSQPNAMFGWMQRKREYSTSDERPRQFTESEATESSSPKTGQVSTTSDSLDANFVEIEL